MMFEAYYHQGLELLGTCISVIHSVVALQLIRGSTHKLREQRRERVPYLANRITLPYIPSLLPLRFCE